jgi:hypothetical protein
VQSSSDLMADEKSVAYTLTEPSEEELAQATMATQM